ncbi:acetyl-CoA synthetase-like protein [Aspergillus homomorphus CBS 101889]|uniref:Acetyl-CoA synthetase-like protein n=1 Tax=Aspergillus homomorphus (strain CBS 101889) TaxID=1450537 RepID=A0A395HLA9_ASPHC|nr:acetyl-CoA synthetase-like protein [Aspergillus homomorphus CBS 101889]RAL08711.1 acetyl-CoA synthetase-like protein [Aspergillus homomorphus CBS 101889]
MSILVDTTVSPFSNEASSSNIARTFKHALSQILQKPHLKLSSLSLITEDDKSLLGSWNTSPPSQPARCVHTAILDNCSKFPHKPAVSAWDGNFTYGELDELSCRLSQQIRALNLSPGTIIPLCFEKSKWVIVAVLGVLRAGAAYAIVDPSSPMARITSVCDDVKASLIVCSKNCLDKASRLVHQVIAVEDAVEEPIVFNDTTSNDAVVELNDPVYVAFTSGSTGRPKGAVIEHGGFYQRAMANGPTLSLSEDSRILQFASFVFDVANRDILYTLLYAGCICIPSDWQRSNELAAFINKQQVNWASITPSAIRILDPNDVPTLRTLVLCGEPMNTSLVARWADRLHLINAYGPSEATTVSSMATVTRSSMPMNIGKGSGSALWIVDPANHDRLVPVGAVGELVIESPSVGRGYLNRPAETASSFLNTTAWLSQFRAQPNPNYLYKTGDLVQYAADGTLLFFGRKDGQIKINGQRVDLGEIEHWIQQSLPPDTQAIIVVDSVVPIGRETAVLVAFCAPKQNHSVTLDVLQKTIPELARCLDQSLPQNLPPYMIPRIYLPIQSIPTTATGKTHRQELRRLGATYTLEALTHASRHPTHPSEPPDHRLNTSSSRLLIDILAAALGVDTSSVRGQDSFLRLGGDSVMAIQVAIQARSEGLDLSAADLLESKSLIELADLVLMRPKVSNAPIIPELFSLCDMNTIRTVRKQLAHLETEYGILDILPTTASQNFFLTQWTLTGYYCMLNGPIDLDRLRAACKAVVCRHSILRTVFKQLSEHEFVQVVLKSVNPTLEYHRIGAERLEDVCSRTVTEIITETAPASGNLLPRFILLSRSDTQHAFIVRISHAQYDGNTSPVLFQDISLAYNNCYSSKNGTTHRLPAATPFQHYLYARDASRSSPENDQAMQFWRENMRGASMTTLTPSLTQRPKGIEPATRVITAPISGLLPTVFGNVTVPTLVNAVCSLLLASLAGSDDVVFGNVIDTRSMVALPGIETTLGPCLNISPLRARLKSRQSTTFADLCHSLSEQYAGVARHAAAWDLPDIAKYCTDWPTGTQIGCMLNHLRPDIGPPPLALDGVECLTFSKSVYLDLPCQLLFRCVSGPEKLDIQVLTASSLMDRPSATRLAERLIDAVKVLSEAPNTLLSDIHV